MAKPNKTADLLKVLGQKAALARSRHPVRHGSRRRTGASPRKPKREVRPREPKPKAVRGKAIQFYLHEADERLIREFAVWLAPHRKRINDSLVVKAVLRAARRARRSSPPMTRP